MLKLYYTFVCMCVRYGAGVVHNIWVKAFVNIRSVDTEINIVRSDNSLSHNAVLISMFSVLLEGNLHSISHPTIKVRYWSLGLVLGKHLVKKTAVIWQVFQPKI